MKIILTFLFLLTNIAIFGAEFQIDDKKKEVLDDLKQYVQYVNFCERFPNSKDVNLVIAASKGDTRLCKFLIKKGAQPENMHHASFKKAVKGNHVDCMKLLLDTMIHIERSVKDIIPNFVMIIDSEISCLLGIAASNAYNEIIVLLINYGVDVDYCRNFLSNTPLHEAAKRGHEETMKLLKGFDADETKKNYENKTAEDLFKEFCSPNFEVKPIKNK